MKKEDVEKKIEEAIEILKIRIKLNNERGEDLDKKFTWEDVLYFKKNELEALLYEITKEGK